MSDRRVFKSITDYLNMLNMIYYVVVGIPLVIFLLIYLRNKSELSENGFLAYDQLTWKLGITIIILILVFMAEIRFKSKMNLDFSQSSIEAKLHHFYHASLWRYLAYGLAAMLSNLGLHLYLEGIFVGDYLIVLFSFSLIRPTKKSIGRAPMFNKEDKQIIAKEDIIP